MGNRCSQRGLGENLRCEDVGFLVLKLADDEVKALEAPYPYQPKPVLDHA